jgi:hypothetical protein
MEQKKHIPTSLPVASILTALHPALKLHPSDVTIHPRKKNQTDGNHECRNQNMKTIQVLSRISTYNRLLRKDDFVIPFFIPQVAL